MSGLMTGATMVAVVTAGGTVLAWRDAVETALYGLNAKPVTQLANPPKVGKMAALGGDVVRLDRRSLEAHHALIAKIG